MNREEADAHLKSSRDLIETITDVHAAKVAWVIWDLLRRSLDEQIRLTERVAVLEAENRELRATVASQQIEIQQLKERCAWLERQLYGKKSEPLPAESESPETAPAEQNPLPPVDQAKIAAARELEKEARKLLRESGYKKPVRPKKPDIVTELVRRRVPHGLECVDCGGAIKDQGMAHLASELDIVPLAYITREYALHRGACGCGAVNFVMPGPDRALDKTEASPRLIAKVISDKFRYHMPIYRQEQRMADEGLFINRNVLNGWVLRAWLEIKPVVTLLGKINRLESHKQCDETPIGMVTDENSKDRYLWCVLTAKAVTFEVTEKRNQAEAKRILGDTPADVLTDGLGIYNKKTITGRHAGCWAHARRKFVMALLSFPKEAWAVLLILRDLFLVEREAKDAGLSADARLRLRKQKSVVLLNELATLLLSMNPPPKSSLGKAIAYTEKRWAELTCFLDDGHLEIHNNAVESLFKAVKLGFKNFLFCQSELGAEAVAGFYSIFATCRLYEIEPTHYIGDVLVKIREGWPQSRIEELLPWNWQKNAPSPADENEKIPYTREEKISADRVIALRKLEKKVRVAGQKTSSTCGPSIVVDAEAITAH